MGRIAARRDLGGPLSKLFCIENLEMSWTWRWLIDTQIYGTLTCLRSQTSRKTRVQTNLDPIGKGHALDSDLVLDPETSVC